MIQLYVSLIRRGTMKLDAVPALWRVKVQAELEKVVGA